MEVGVGEIKSRIIIVYVGTATLHSKETSQYTINHEFTYVTFQRFELFKKDDYEYRITNPWMNTTGTTKGDDDIPEIK